jgi:hypothetical protein
MKGDAQAVKIFADADGHDPEFYQLVRSLDAYRNSITTRSTQRPIASADGCA